jgi:tetratricopeptide (TPR) repeat protein
MIEQNRGVLANMRGDFRTAEKRYRDSLRAFERANDTEAMSWVLNNLGMLFTRTGDYDAARTALERGVLLAILRKDSAVEGILFLNLGEMWLASGDLVRAERSCTRSLEDAKRRGDRLTTAEALKCRAKIEHRRGNYDCGVASLKLAQQEASGAEDRLLGAEILRELGEISRSRGDTRAARSAWSDAAEEFRNAGAVHDALQVESLLQQLAG